MRRLAPSPLALLIGSLALISVSSSARAAAALNLAAYRGKVVYLDFWASWCTPCRAAFPWLQAMNDAYERRGLEIVAVNLDHDRAAADQFLARFAPRFDVRFDPEGTLAERFAVGGMPTSIIVDRQGKIRFTHIGFRNAERADYESELRGLLAEH